jgi:nucleoside-triphosphatase
VLTGEKGAGKTSLVRSVLAHVRCAVGGFFTKAVCASGHRLGYEIVDVQTGERMLFARRVPGSRAPRGGPFTVDSGVFDFFGTQIVERAQRHADLVVMDEIGCMERDSLLFQEAIWTCLTSGVPTIAVVQMGECPFVQKLMASFKSHLLRVPAGEEERIRAQVFTRLKQWGVPTDD